MAKIRGAYALGKAMIEAIEGLEEQLDTTEGGAIANTLDNRNLVRDALVDASRQAGFISMFVFLGGMLPREKAEQPSLLALNK